MHSQLCLLIPDPRMHLHIRAIPASHLHPLPQPLKVIEMMNKPEGFDENDEKLVGMLAAHVGAFMGQVSEGRAGRQEYGEAVPLQRLPTPKC